MKDQPQVSGGPKLVARNVSKIYSSARGDVHALEDINLEVDDGGFFTLIGHSGCGKSTFLRIAAGLEEATSGEILVDGEVHTNPDQDRGMVFQSYTLFPWLTVVQNIEFGLRMRQMNKKERREKALSYLELVHLEEFANSYPKELSGGMKQRVAIARAVANEPKVLMMDEPFGALDADTRERMQNLLLEIRDTRKLTVVFITHDIDEAIVLSEKIAILSARPGQLQQIMDVTLPYPRDIEMKMSPEFIAIKRQLIDVFQTV